MATWQHLRSSTAHKRPTTSLADGRIAINTNTASPGLFFKDSAGTGIVKVGPVHVGTTAPNSMPAAGGSTGNYKGEQWLDTSLTPAQLKVWNGSQWIGVVADELPVSKLQDGAARQLLQTDAAGTGVEWTNNVDVPGTLDVTGATTLDSTLTVPLGSAASPTLRFSGDANTGVYSPGADQLALSTNGTGRLFVDASGKVGIGVETPATDLHISSSTPRLTFTDTDTGADHRINANSGTGNFAIDVDVNSETSTPSLIATIKGSERLRITSTGQLSHIGGGSAVSPAVGFNGSAPSNSLVIDSAGLVGIGTSSPDTLVEIEGSSSPILRINDTGPTLPSFGQANSGIELVGGQANTTNKYMPAIKFGSSDVNFTTLNPKFGAAITAEAAETFAADTDGGMSLAFWTTPKDPGTNGDLRERMRIDYAGNVGIGTSSPSDLLNLSAAEPYLQIGSSASQTGNNIGGIRFTTVDPSYAAGGFPAYINAHDFSTNGSAFGLVFGTQNTDQMVVDNLGRVGIGTTSPTETLEVVGNAILDASNATLKIKQGTTGTTGAIDFTLNSDSTSYGSLNLDYDSRTTQGLRLNTPYPLTLECGSAEEIIFKRGTTENARIDSSGRLLVGTSSSSDGNSTIETLKNGENRIKQYSHSDSGINQYVFLKTRGSSGSPTAVASGTNLGRIAWQGYDGSAFHNTGFIDCVVDGTPGTNDMPGRIVLSTTPDGSASPVERMRITSDGSTLIGTTTSVSVTTGTEDGFTAYSTGATHLSRSGAVSLWLRRRTSDGSIAAFYRDTTQVGTISVTTTATAYNTSSDYRLKENVTPVTDGITRLQQLKPSRFNFIADPTKTVDGFLAHEVQAIVPEAITGDKDAVDEEGNPLYQGIDQSKIVPLVVAALQEAIAKIETLEQRLSDAGIN